MKLTKDQRFTAYCIMLEESNVVLNNWKFGSRTDYYSGGVIGGLCDLIENIIEYDCYDILKELGLIELSRKKPAKSGGYWFGNNIDGWENRISLLKQCIEQTAP